MLKRTYRIQGDKDVTKIYRRGRGVRLGPLSLKHTNNQLDHSRLGVVVSKKVSKSAPVRNRIRRRIYEHTREQWPHIAVGQDIIISVFADDLAKLPANQLSGMLDELFNRAKLWVDDTEA